MFPQLKHYQIFHILDYQRLCVQSNTNLVKPNRLDRCTGWMTHSRPWKSWTNRCEMCTCRKCRLFLPSKMFNIVKYWNRLVSTIIDNVLHSVNVPLIILELDTNDILQLSCWIWGIFFTAFPLDVQCKIWDLKQNQSGTSGFIYVIHDVQSYICTSKLDPR